MLEDYSRPGGTNDAGGDPNPRDPVASYSTGPNWLGQRTHLKLDGTGADSA